MVVSNVKAISKLEDYRDNMVRQSNILIEAMCKASLNGQKFFELMVSMTNKENEEDDNPFYFRVKDLQQLFGIKSSGSAYVEIPRVTKELMGKVISYATSNTKLKQRPLLSMADHDSGTGIVGAKIHKDIKPFVKNLKDNYAEYQLKYIMGCKSNYSILLYKIAKMYGNNAQFIIDLNELKRILNAESYDRHDNFKRKVLDFAINEINEKTDITLTYENIKEGKKIKALEFTTTLNEKSLLGGLNKEILDEMIKVSDIINSLKNNTGGAEINQSVLTTLIEQKGYDTVKYYADNISSYVSVNTQNVVGLFIDAIKKHGTEKQYSKNVKAISQKCTVPQTQNYEQRKFEDSYFEDLYENVKSS